MQEVIMFSESMVCKGSLTRIVTQPTSVYNADRTLSWTYGRQLVHLDTKKVIR